MTARDAPKRKPRRKKRRKNARGGEGKWNWIPSSTRSRRALLAAAAVTGLVALGVAAHFAREGFSLKPLSAPYRPVIGRWSAEYGVDSALVAAVLECESSGRVRAVSESGALGLMQLMPRTARAMAKELGLAEPAGRDLFEAELNIRLGSYYLSKLWKRYEGDRLLVVAAYHAGPTNVDLWRRQREYESTERFIAEVDAPRTRGHVRKVMKRWEKLAEKR